MYKGSNLLALLTVTLFGFIATAEARNLPVPSTPSGYDRVRTTEGSECQSSIAGNLQVYAGVYNAEYDDPYFMISSGINRQMNDQGFQAGITYSFGGGERINCARMYNIEVERAQMELEKLKSEIEMMKKLKTLEMMEQAGVSIPEPEVK